MTGAELKRHRQDRLQLHVDDFAKLVGAGGRNVRRWQAGTQDIPGQVIDLLWLLSAMPLRQRREYVVTRLGYVPRSYAGQEIDGTAGPEV